MDFATLLRTLFSRGNSFVLKFLFIVLGCWDVGLAKRVIPFSRSGVLFLGKQFWRVQHPTRSFSFVSQNGVLRSEDFLSWANELRFVVMFSIVFSVILNFLYYCSILEEDRRARKNKSCRKERIGDGNSTLRYNVNEHTWFTFIAYFHISSLSIVPTWEGTTWRMPLLRIRSWTSQTREVGAFCRLTYTTRSARPGL